MSEGGNGDEPRQNWGSLIAAGGLVLRQELAALDWIRRYSELSVGFPQLSRR